MSQRVTSSDLQAALATNDLGVATVAHHTLSEQVELLDGDGRGVDPARERALRRTVR